MVVHIADATKFLKLILLCVICSVNLFVFIISSWNFVDDFNFNVTSWNLGEDFVVEFDQLNEVEGLPEFYPEVLKNNTYNPNVEEAESDQLNEVEGIPGSKPFFFTNITGPPFRIIQCGAPRSASTFQYALLKAIVYVKSIQVSKQSPDIYETFIKNKKNKEDWKRFVDRVGADRSFVAKLHEVEDIEFKEWIDHHHVSVFTSGHLEKNNFCKERTIYHQTKPNIENCSMCEIDNYKDIFGLDKENIDMIRKHMFLFEKIRKCCGTQMSRYRRFELHGCDMSPYKEQDPKCDEYPMEYVELLFAASPFPYKQKYPRLDWAKPGDCAKFNEIIKDGKDFNMRTFEGCDSMSKLMDKGM
uniref:Uncharacterized protein n=1 Tax=Corethron hystrix TaxID=216773 RepID=A0A7S1BF36_9STRA|mmetsp:Transcript_25426/g.58673  ORF Transcript_25426/g.58673 Transcript_25426/m.58673 type:complete len:357 (+) Transcript_25426:76-1146(+)